MSESKVTAPPPPDQGKASGVHESLLVPSFKKNKSWDSRSSDIPLLAAAAPGINNTEEVKRNSNDNALSSYEAKENITETLMSDRAEETDVSEPLVVPSFNESWECTSCDIHFQPAAAPGAVTRKEWKRNSNNNALPRPVVTKDSSANATYEYESNPRIPPYESFGTTNPTTVPLCGDNPSLFPGAAFHKDTGIPHRMCDGGGETYEQYVARRLQELSTPYIPETNRCHVKIYQPDSDAEDLQHSYPLFKHRAREEKRHSIRTRPTVDKSVGVFTRSNPPTGAFTPKHRHPVNLADEHTRKSRGKSSAKSRGRSSSRSNPPTGKHRHVIVQEEKLPSDNLSVGHETGSRGRSGSRSQGKHKHVIVHEEKLPSDNLSVGHETAKSRGRSGSRSQGKHSSRTHRRHHRGPTSNRRSSSRSNRPSGKHRHHVSGQRGKRASANLSVDQRRESRGRSTSRSRGGNSSRSYRSSGHRPRAESRSQPGRNKNAAKILKKPQDSTRRKTQDVMKKNNGKKMRSSRVRQGKGQH